jgi:hypothetical protein
MWQTVSGPGSVVPLKQRHCETKRNLMTVTTGKVVWRPVSGFRLNRITSLWRNRISLKQIFSLRANFCWNSINIHEMECVLHKYHRWKHILSRYTRVPLCVTVTAILISHRVLTLWNYKKRLMFLCKFSSGLASTSTSRSYHLSVEDLTTNVLPCIGSVCVTCHYHRSPKAQ